MNNYDYIVDNDDVYSVWIIDVILNLIKIMLPT